MKWALVTGASSGIGWSISMELAHRGYNIVGVSNQAKQLSVWKAAITEKYAVNAMTCELDLSLIQSPQKLYDWCKEQYLTIEVLVNNAGILITDTMVEADTMRISTLTRLHVHATTILCRLFADDMVRINAGHILNVSSISAVLPYPIISLYGPSKAYLRSFTRAIRTELKPENVVVSCVLPGATDTPLNDISDGQKRLAFRLGVNT